MIEEKLTEKEWEVLKYFIKKESEVIESYLESQRCNPSKNFQSFCSYPEDMIGQRVINASKPKIIDSCKKLYEEGILETKEYKAKNNRKTISYSLKSDIENIKVLVRLIAKKPSKEAIEILSYRYFSYHIDESLIREILSNKGVSIQRCIPLIEWERDQAQHLLGILMNESHNLERSSILFDDSLKKVLIRYEEENKKYEEEYLNHLSKLFRQFFEDLDDPSLDVKKLYYSKDYLLFQNLSYKEIRSLHREDISKFLDYSLHFFFNVKLPVFKDTFSLEDKIKIIRELNSYLFSDEGSDFKGLTKDDLIRNSSGLCTHYSVFEYKALVLPILALVWCSPAALYEFLCGEWEGFELYVAVDGRCKENGFITKLLHIATKDILANLEIPRNTIVDSVSSKKFPPCWSSPMDKILVTSGHEKYQLYDKLTDIERNYWNSKPYDEIERLVNASLRIKLKHLWEIFINVGFSVVSDSSESSSIIESVSIDINSDLLPSLLTVNDINDPSGLISKLQQKNCSLYQHVLNMFSNKAKNIVLIYDTSEQPSIQLQEMIVQELNSILLDGYFCDESAFSPIMQEDENVKRRIEELLSYRYSKKEILNMVDKKTSFESTIISRNRYLLEKIFENELTQNYVPLVDQLIRF
ncbi:hypothetical protein [uncultured Methanomethylovorans sp.]|uniref:hypothetical protein n=1 Tax=uncultured Methanomethylovorans sp. TaxID=183759 RepID=UPI002AA8F215|nr:hypothetical protein [uncultured Methanomethylovorans sp.]